MFRNGQFGQGHVFMEDLLSQPVQIDQPQPAQMPPVQMPMVQQAAPQQDNGMSALGGGIGSLLGLGSAALMKDDKKKSGGDSYTQDPNFGGGSSLSGSEIANLANRGFNMSATQNTYGGSRGQASDNLGWAYGSNPTAGSTADAIRGYGATSSLGSLVEGLLGQGSSGILFNLLADAYGGGG